MNDFRFPYVFSPRKLNEEFKKRKEGESSEKALRYLNRRFGLNLDDLNIWVEGIGMWRQYFGIHFENAVVEMLCRTLNFERENMTYLKDGYSSRNPYKFSLVKPKFLRRNKRWEIVSYKISESFFENQIIENILTIDNARKSCDFHRDVMVKYGYSARNKDISSLLSLFVHASFENLEKREIGNIFDRVFVVEQKDGFGVRVRYDFDSKRQLYVSKNKTLTIQEMKDLAEKKAVFPSAKTYYREFYFFFPGIIFHEYAQIEAEFETSDSYIHENALYGIKKVKDVTGFYPLIIPIPDFNAHKEFHFTKNPACVCICEDIETLFQDFKRNNHYNNFYRLAYELGMHIMNYASLNLHKNL